MNLSINYDELEMVAKNLITKAGDFESLVKNIQNINSQISECWQGSDATKYLNAVSTQITYMYQLSTAISEIGNYLNRVSESYKSVAVNNSNSINLQ